MFLRNVKIFLGENVFNRILAYKTNLIKFKTTSSSIYYELVCKFNMEFSKNLNK